VPEKDDKCVPARVIVLNITDSGTCQEMCCDPLVSDLRPTRPHLHVVKAVKIAGNAQGPSVPLGMG